MFLLILQSVRHGLSGALITGPDWIVSSYRLVAIVAFYANYASVMLTSAYIMWIAKSDYASGHLPSTVEDQTKDERKEYRHQKR